VTRTGGRPLVLDVPADRVTGIDDRGDIVGYRVTRDDGSFVWSAGRADLIRCWWGDAAVARRGPTSRRSSGR
jgi:hypothetical protein